MHGQMLRRKHPKKAYKSIQQPAQTKEKDKEVHPRFLILNLSTDHLSLNGDLVERKLVLI